MLSLNSTLLSFNFKWLVSTQHGLKSALNRLYLVNPDPSEPSLPGDSARTGCVWANYVGIWGTVSGQEKNTYILTLHLGSCHSVCPIGKGPKN